MTELLSEKHLHVTTAESCTGGLISGTLVNAAGASAVLNGGMSLTQMKRKSACLSSHETLETYGAVSEQTAKEMAEGAAKAQVQKRLLARQELPVQVEEQRTSLSDSCI